MKRALAAFTLATLGFYANQQAHAVDNKGLQLKDKKDKISYSIGVDVGKSIRRQKIEVNPEAFIAGFQDGQNNQSTLLSEKEVGENLMIVQTEMIERQKAEVKELAAKNLAEGEKFLAENKKKDGVITLPDGLQYRIINKGKENAPSPKATDTVTTHYRGKFIDNKEFDSSYTRGEPVKFTVNGVIPGWTEVLQLMRPGAKWEVFVPAKLAYGEQGVGQLIAPNSTLIFEIELLEVEKPNSQKETDAQKNTTSKKK